MFYHYFILSFLTETLIQMHDSVNPPVLGAEI